MIEAFVAIITGLVLAVSILPGGGVLRALMPFKIIIGIVALVIGILNITSILGIALIAGGLVLALKTLGNVPAIGVYLKQAGQFLTRFQVIIGIVLIIIGVLEVLKRLINNIE